MAEGDFESYYRDTSSEYSFASTAVAPPPPPKGEKEKLDEFADPVLPVEHLNPIMISRQVRSPDSPRSRSPVAPDDYPDTRSLRIDTFGLEADPTDESLATTRIPPVRAQTPTHREGEQMELPQTPHTFFEDL